MNKDNVSGFDKDVKDFLEISSSFTFEIRNEQDVKNHINNLTKVFNKNFRHDVNSETLRWICAPSSVNVDIFCLCKIASMLR